jgi:hypothetical protein
MKFVFEERPSDSPYVDSVWSTQTANSGSFISVAESHWGMVVTRQNKNAYLTIRGPETKAMPSPVPANAEIFGIIFKIGTFMPDLPASDLVNEGMDLPEATGKTFWLHGSAWQFPDFDNADTFVDKLVREGLLVHEPLVESVLQGRPQPLSIRTVRRRFLRATGLTHGTIFQIERARRAMTLLQQGASILDTVYDAGYFDQPHLTRSLKHFFGQTPAQIVQPGEAE